MQDGLNNIPASLIEKYSVELNIRTKDVAHILETILCRSRYDRNLVTALIPNDNISCNSETHL